MLGAGNSYDGLDEDWAQPMAALPVERAIVSGAITDEQGKFNLNNLVSGGNKSLPDVQAFQRLLSLLGLSPDLADAVVDWIDIDSDLSGPAGAEDPYYLSLARPYRASNGPMVQVEELYRVRGFDPATVAKLKPYVTTLRDTSPTTVNVNTASDVVLMALMPDMPKTRIENFIAARRTQPIKTTDQLSAFTKPLAGGTPSSLGFKSNFFSVRIVVSQDDVQLATDAQLRRVNGNVAIVWRRPIY